jgi:pimeloyl-ACP methyl ester carboxylesterase
MRRFLALAAVLVGVVGAASPAQTPPADDKSTVSFETIDHVHLSGTFYKGSKGIESPAVMMVHRFNSDRNAKGWESLATHLRDKLNASVLTFDLRGHGGSKSVDAKFWSYEHNKNGIRGGQAARPKSEISTSDFKGTYWPILLNDLAAARYYLDQQNDAQLCNASSIIIIAAQESAGLGIGWACHEWDRKVLPTGTSLLTVTPTGHVPGEDLACCVWLGPAARGGSVTFKDVDWINKAPKLRESTPMFFLYGKDDPNASMVAGAFSALKRPPDNLRTKQNYDKDEKLNTKLPGQDLVGNAALDVNKKIEAYVEGILKNYRKNVAWKSMNAAPPAVFPLATLGFQQPN